MHVEQSLYWTWSHVLPQPRRMDPTWAHISVKRAVMHKTAVCHVRMAMDVARLGRRRRARKGGVEAWGRNARIGTCREVSALVSTTPLCPLRIRISVPSTAKRNQVLSTRDEVSA